MERIKILARLEVVVCNDHIIPVTTFKDNISILGVVSCTNNLSTPFNYIAVFFLKTLYKEMLIIILCINRKNLKRDLKIFMDYKIFINLRYISFWNISICTLFTIRR